VLVPIDRFLVVVGPLPGGARSHQQRRTAAREGLWPQDLAGAAAGGRKRAAACGSLLGGAAGSDRGGCRRFDCALQGTQG
jgi:hypothetical protein